MLFSIISAHGTGKTTLVSYLHKSLKTETIPFVIIYGITRHCPFPVGKSSGRPSQNWVMSTQKYFEDNCSNMCCPIITDRNMIDQYAYYIYWAGENKAIEKEIRTRYINNSRIYLMPLNSAYLIADGLRPVDINFQYEINSIILNILERLEINIFCDIVNFNENYKDDIVEDLKKVVSTDCISKEVTNAEYDYDNNIFNKIVAINNLSFNNFQPSDFDKLFYNNLILPMRSLK